VMVAMIGMAPAGGRVASPVVGDTLAWILVFAWRINSRSSLARFPVNSLPMSSHWVKSILGSETIPGTTIDTRGRIPGECISGILSGIILWKIEVRGVMRDHVQKHHEPLGDPPALAMNNYGERHYPPCFRR
jgi:hypothetical protein